jgi:hypothetical protein
VDSPMSSGGRPDPETRFNLGSMNKITAVAVAQLRRRQPSKIRRPALLTTRTRGGRARRSGMLTHPHRQSYAQYDARRDTLQR